MDPEVFQSSIDHIARELLTAITANAEEIRFSYWQIGWKSQERVELRVDGEWLPMRLRIDSDSVMDLRDASASPETGAWFAAKIVVDGEGNITTDFDYDIQPQFTILPILQHDIEVELDKWPRTGEHIPCWMSKKLAEFGME